jgi:MFS family permease
MALIAFVYGRAPGSSFEIAKVMVFTIIPVFLIGPLAGVYVDRWDRRKTMYVCDIIRSGLILLIPLFLFYSRSVIPIYLIVFVSFCIGRFFVPAKMSIRPDLVEKKDLVLANSLVNTTGMIAAVLGFGASGVLVERLGAQSGFYLDSLSFLLSAAFIFFIAYRSSRSVSIAEVGKELVSVIRTSVMQEFLEGIRYFMRTKSIRLAAGLISLLWAALGAVYVVAIVFIQRTLGSATRDLGLLGMVLGFGLFTGSVWYGRFGQRFSQYKSIFSALILTGCVLILFTVALSHYPHFWAAATLAFLLGVSVSPIMIASNTIIHTASENAMMGKIFSSLEIVMHAAFLVCMLLTSWLAERIDPSVILISVGVAVIGIGLIIIINARALKAFERVAGV